MRVIWFDTERQAARWAERFAYGRRLSNLPPLTIEADRGQWAVNNPTYGGPVRAQKETTTQEVSLIHIASKRVRGRRYPVSIRADGTARCPCDGFVKWHGRCSHADEALAKWRQRPHPTTGSDGVRPGTEQSS